MQRIKIILPEQFNFSTQIAVRITDLNYGNHVGNDSFFALMHEARQQYLHSLGYSELDFAGTSLIMADAMIEYKDELHYGDNVTIKVIATNFDKIGFDIFYLFEKQENEKNIVVAKAKTGIMCFDYTNKKRKEVPNEMIEKMK